MASRSPLGQFVQLLLAFGERWQSSPERQALVDEMAQALRASLRDDPGLFPTSSRKNASLDRESECQESPLVQHSERTTVESNPTDEDPTLYRKAFAVSAQSAGTTTPEHRKTAF